MSRVTQISIFLPILVIAGAYIWLHSLRWWEMDSDSILLLANFAIIFYLGKPWSAPTAGAGPIRPVVLFPALLLFGIGVLGDLAWAMALGWAICFYLALGPSFSPRPTVSLFRLMPFAFLAFPWIALDGQTIGWYFRISGAAVNEIAFSVLGMDVMREGVNMVISGVVIKVADECAGLNSLQAMMVAGGFLAFHFFGRSRSTGPLG